jgi:hypothetical protein
VIPVATVMSAHVTDCMRSIELKMNCLSYLMGNWPPIYVTHQVPAIGSPRTPEIRNKCQYLRGIECNISGCPRTCSTTIAVIPIFSFAIFQIRPPPRTLSECVTQCDEALLLLYDLSCQLIWVTRTQKRG